MKTKVIQRDCALHFFQNTVGICREAFEHRYFHHLQHFCKIAGAGPVCWRKLIGGAFISTSLNLFEFWAIVRSCCYTCECNTCSRTLLILCSSSKCVRQAVKCALLLSVHCCKNKQDSRGFQHCGDQLEQSSPISAGKAQCHAALFRNQEEPPPPPMFGLAKVLTAERWKLIQKFAERKELVADFTTLHQQRTGMTQRHIRGRKGNMAAVCVCVCVSGLESTDTAAALGKSCLLCFMFSIWMKICCNCCFLLKHLWRTSPRKALALQSQLSHLFLF